MKTGSHVAENAAASSQKAGVRRPSDHAGLFSAAAWCRLPPPSG